jgi:D,D-heptose 1,7-bisphosphate phosphatase
MKLAIIAGGKGTRLGFKDIPKPMALLDNKPLLEHQILLAKKFNITEIFILSGYLSNIIVDYFGDGTKWGVKITHIVEKKALGTAGAIKQLEGIINERFMVFYGDTVMDIDLDSLINFDKKNDKAIGTILVHPNDHPYDSDLLEINNECKVIEFHSKPHEENRYYFNLVNAALYIFSQEIFKYIDNNISLDFGKDIFPKLIQNGETLYAYQTTEYIKDMGTPERLKKVEKDLLSGKINRLNKSKKQKAIFIDRDGVINREVDELSNIADFELLIKTADAIKLINKSDYICIVVTNQPMLAKGFLTFDELSNIHKKMDTLLGLEKAYADDLFYCPHHPEKGFDGEIKELKVACDCRKPNPGMLKEAAIKYNIDLKNSWMIGDRYTDILAGINASTQTCLVKTGHAGNDKDKYKNVNANLIADNLYEAVSLIIGECNDNN